MFRNLKNEVVAALAKALAEVRRAVEDWRAMLVRVTGLIADLKNSPPPLPAEEIAESIQFLEWLMEDNFTFLGVRDYRLRVVGVIRDYGMLDREQAPADSLSYHDGAAESK